MEGKRRIYTSENQAQRKGPRLATGKLTKLTHDTHHMDQREIDTPQTWAQGRQHNSFAPGDKGGNFKFWA